MADIHVYVYEDEDAGELRVYPPVIKADGGGGGGAADKLFFHNSSNQDLVFCFGKKALNTTVQTFIGVEKGNTTNGDTVKSQGNGKSEAYAYQVVAYKKGKKAKGNSDPLLIIEN